MNPPYAPIPPQITTCSEVNQAMDPIQQARIELSKTVESRCGAVELGSYLKVVHPTALHAI
jgi:hypothetical protein